MDDGAEDTPVQFTDEFQRALIAHLDRQTSALESIRYVLWFCFTVGVIGGILAVIIAMQQNGL